MTYNVFGGTLNLAQLNSTPFRGGSMPHGSWATASPHAKRHLDRVSHLCAVRASWSLYFSMAGPFPILKLPFPPKELALGPYHKWFLRHT